jgi:hypothetical protein
VITFARLVVAQLDHRCRNRGGATLDLHLQDLPDLYGLVELVAYQRLNIGVGDGFFLVRQIFKTFERSR